MHRRSVAAFDRFLFALSAIIDKAEAHCEARKIKPEVILQDRLFPDMFPFIQQVQLTCDFAARGTARLVGQEPQSFPDTETSFTDLRNRIAATRNYIASFEAPAFIDAETRPVHFKTGGRDMVLPGEEFLSLYTLPQFFFHLTTAYNILRHNGIELGKRDFMGAA
jgi:hypothetical protein